MTALAIHSIVWGVTDIGRAVSFWSAALGYTLSRPAEDDWAILLPTDGGPGVQLSLKRVSSPEARRHHMDLLAADQAAEVTRLLALGAVRVPWDYEAGADYVVLADPDGNSFCVVASPEGAA